MTVKKYKLNDIAKDLGVNAKEVAGMLAAHFGTEPKKTGAVLTEQEVNVVFEHYTNIRRKNQPDRAIIQKKFPIGKPFIQNSVTVAAILRSGRHPFHRGGIHAANSHMYF